MQIVSMVISREMPVGKCLKYGIVKKIFFFFFEINQIIKIENCSNCFVGTIFQNAFTKNKFVKRAVLI